MEYTMPIMIAILFGTIKGIPLGLTALGKFRERDSVTDIFIGIKILRPRLVALGRITPCLPAGRRLSNPHESETVHFLRYAK